jgi:peptide/nickel transport system substrate-binding protein
MERGELVARGVALVAAIAVSLLAVAGAGGADAQSPKRGGTVVLLRLAFTEPGCLNPLTCPVHGDPMLTQVLEGAFEIGPDLVPRPNLVSHVDVDRSPFSLTYHIRPQARWSDGVPVTASDFRFTHRMLSAHLEDPDGIYDRVRSVRVLDAKTFRVDLREPFAKWERLLYNIVLPRHVLAGRDVTKVWIDGIDDPRTGRPIGSGPFLVADWQRGARLTLVRNPRYWGPHTAYLDRFVWRFARQDPLDPIAPLRQNEFDVTLSLGGSFVSADIARDVRKLEAWRVLAWPTNAMEHFAFRVGPGGHPALRLKLVRRALAFGIDRVAIAREILSDVSSAVRRPLDSTAFYANEPLYRANWSGYRYDVARSRQLLEQAGCRRGDDGVYSCAGERLRLRFVTSAGNPVRTRTLELAQAHLRKVGVDVDLEFAPSGAFLNQILVRGDFDAVLFAWVNFGGLVWPEGWCEHEQNFVGFCSRLITRDLQQVDRIVDPVQRARVLNAADAKLARAVPALPVVQPVFRAVIKPTVRGIHPGGSQFELSENSEDWWLAQPR